jgi:hypothetical protein
MELHWSWAGPPGCEIGRLGIIPWRMKKENPAVSGVIPAQAEIQS